MRERESKQRIYHCVHETKHASTCTNITKRNILIAKLHLTNVGILSYDYDSHFIGLCSCISFAIREGTLTIFCQYHLQNCFFSWYDLFCLWLQHASERLHMKTTTTHETIFLLLHRFVSFFFSYTYYFIYVRIIFALSKNGEKVNSFVHTFIYVFSNFNLQRQRFSC